jgi:hypothetical protein
MNILIKPFINSISLYIYDISNNMALLIVFSFICAIFVLSLLFLLKKKKYLICAIDIFILVLLIVSSIFFYNRGNKINEIRDNGYLLLNFIEKFNTLNNRFPYDIEEIYSFISSKSNNDLQKIKKTKNSYYYVYKALDNGNNCKFYLTIYDDILGFEYFAYRNNPVRFELTDD